MIEVMENTKCSICGTTWGVTFLREDDGIQYYCCGWCWAHVFGGGFIPADLKTAVASARHWLSTDEREKQAGQ